MQALLLRQDFFVLLPSPFLLPYDNDDDRAAAAAAAAAAASTNLSIDRSIDR